MAKRHCSECDNPIWARGLCLACDKVANKSKYEIKKKVGNTANATHKLLGQKLGHSVQPLKRSYIKPISDKKASELKEYRLVRDKFFKDNPICQFDGCNSKDIQLHHAKGRLGNLLSDVQYFRSLCDTHHRYVETHPLEAKQMGLSLDRLTK